MKFEVLLSRGEGADRWRELISMLPPSARDLHFLPEYYEIYRKTYGFEPMLALVKDDHAAILQPFVIRTLQDPPFDLTNPPARDIANAYGYGGPLGIGEPADLLRLAPRFGELFHRHLSDLGIASEFCSLHPFLLDWQRPLVEAMGLSPSFEKSVAYLDAHSCGENLLATLGRGTRSKISRARRKGVQVQKVEMSQANLSAFEILYRSTMLRKGAAERWFFPDGYFSNCILELGAQRTSLFFATIDGRLASAYFLIHDFDSAYYHFGASDEAFLDARPNDLMLVETAEWTMRSGFLRYHLGGGVSSSPDDTLMKFKSSVGKATAPLYTFFRVHDAPGYDKLASMKRSYEIKNYGSESASAFLPIYRRSHMSPQPL